MAAGRRVIQDLSFLDCSSACISDPIEWIETGPDFSWPLCGEAARMDSYLGTRPDRVDQARELRFFVRPNIFCMTNGRKRGWLFLLH